MAYWLVCQVSGLCVGFGCVWIAGGFVLFADFGLFFLRFAWVLG